MYFARFRWITVRTGGPADTDDGCVALLVAAYGQNWHFCLGGFLGRLLKNISGSRG